MASSVSSNVILAKARAMFGHSLKKEDYDALLKCRSVSDVAGYLKKTSAYGLELSSVNEATVHRGYLEALLHQKLFDDYAKLCRYEITVGEHFSDYIIEKGEIEQILNCLRLIQTGRSHEYILTIPVFFSKYAKIDTYALAKATTIKEVDDALEKTDYRDILDPFIANLAYGDTNFDFTAIENALYTHLYKKVFEIIDKHAPKGAKKELSELMGSYIDYENVSRIMRLKKYYNASPDFIRSTLLPFSYQLNPKLRREILGLEDVSKVEKALKGTVFGKSMEKYKDDSFDLVALRCNYARSLKKLRFSVQPSVVMLSYLFLVEVELENITNIIEGIRYKLLPSEIEKLLIGIK